jgi:hypothetical protein
MAKGRCESPTDTDEPLDICRSYESINAVEKQTMIILRPRNCSLESSSMRR